MLKARCPGSFLAVPRYRLVDLFAGCGAMSRGFVDSGRFEPVLAVESDSRAAATYEANFPATQVLTQPIETVQAFPKADVVIGGPPCQGFSTLNRTGLVTESRRLWREYLRGLLEVEPAFFVMENVPQMLESDEYREFSRRVRGAGYTVAERIFNAADFGVAQRRRRAFVIGTPNDSITWPAPTHVDPEKHDSAREPWVCFWDVMHDLPLAPDGQRWHRVRHPWPESVVRYQAVPIGGNRFDMQEELDRRGLGHLVPPCWRRHRTGSHDVFGRLWWDRPATTIRTEFYKPEKGRYLHPSEDRAITVREAARLMSFPDNFILPEDQPMTSIARQIGNAVPTRMAQRLAEAIAASLEALDGEGRSALELVA